MQTKCMGVGTAMVLLLLLFLSESSVVTLAHLQPLHPHELLQATSSGAAHGMQAFTVANAGFEHPSYFVYQHTNANSKTTHNSTSGFLALANPMSTVTNLSQPANSMLVGTQPTSHQGLEAAAGTKSLAARPLIFIVDPGGRFRQNMQEYIYGTMYALELVFPQLLRASPHFTSDPSAADFFYVDAWLYHSEYRNISDLMLVVQSTPYWQRNGGHDHIFAMPMDLGICGDLATSRLMRDAIMMQHWGKTTRSNQHNPCMMFGDPMKAPPTTNCDMVFQMSEFEELSQDSTGAPHIPCYVPGKDLLVPHTGSEDMATTRFLHSANFSSNLTTKLFFAGGLFETHISNPKRPDFDAGYSFGARQSAWRMFRNLPGYIVQSKVDNYYEELHKSLFCLAPTGWGWGARFKTAVTRGCIPIVVQDGIRVSWEHELPMADFAVRLPLLYLHRTPELIDRFIQDGRIAHFHRSLSCVWRLFWWRRPEGRAFEMTMCTLKARLLGAKVDLNFDDCSLQCGDGRRVHFNGPAVIVTGI